MTTKAQTASLSNPLYARGKELARRIFHEALTAIDVQHAMTAKLKYAEGALVAGGVSHPLPRPPRVVAFGKAANRMAAVLNADSRRPN